jgi:site-specific DNA recombinase
LTIAPSSARRAVGVVRVSRKGEREGERFASPSEQKERIATACERDGLELVDTIEEMDVSGGTPLVKRHGLRRAVEMVEAGEAEAVVVAYLDRLVRSLTVQAEVVQRVEAAGGAILAVDVGRLTNGSAGSWLSGTMLGAVAEYHRRATAERTSDARRRAVERGVPPFPNVPPGYRRRDDDTDKAGPLEPNPVTAPVVAEAFRLRAEGATIMEVRAFLAERGIRRSFHGVQALLSNRIYIGELHFGETVNPTSHVPIVDVETFQRVQRMQLPRGRRPSSERLLARLGILRCGTCGARMVIGTTRQRERVHSFYRCPPIADCPRRVTIAAEFAERVVAEAVQEALRGVEGRAGIGEGIETAARELERAQDALRAAIRAFAPVMDEPTARERLTELRQERDEAETHLEALSAAQAPAVTVTAGDWDRLTMDERRALIRAVVASASVAPGRGPDRITVQLVGE